MQVILDNALTATAAYWPSLILFFTWLGQATAILATPDQSPVARVRAQYQDLLASFAAELLTPVGEALHAWGSHFLEITQRYWTGLFPCYEVADLPRTNNDLEHLFGKLRHHERRTTGRKVATPSLIIRGSVRVLSAVLSWLQPLTPRQLGQVDLVQWQEERRQTPADAGAPVAFPSTARTLPGRTRGTTRQAEFASIEKMRPGIRGWPGRTWGRGRFKLCVYLGMRTVSITWITPLLVTMSVLVTVAPSTFTPLLVSMTMD